MRALPFTLLLLMTSAQASILQLCPANAPADGTPQAAVTLADGSRHQLRIGDAPQPGCRQLALPVPADAIAAIHPLAPAIARAAGDTLLLHGPAGEDAVIGSVSGGIEPAPPARQPMPFDENLLPAMSARPFGVEERVRVQLAGGRLRLQCGAGTRPAGVLLGGPWYLTQARLALQATTAGHGAGPFALAMADAAGAARETALPLGRIDGAGSTALRLPDAGFARAGWRHFSIACPPQAATLELADLRLAPVAGPPRARASWVWEAQAWMDGADAVLADAQTHGIRTLFVSVPVAAGAVAEPARLAAFVRRARALAIDVWPVDGDPHMVLPDQHAPTVARVRAYLAYNRSAPPAARLGGVQFDIEPYLLPGYEAAARELDRRYLELARALRRAAGGLPLEFVVPFWWSDREALLEGLAAAASGLTVMDYRTDPAQIRRFALPFLDWGARHGKRVRIALEAGPVAPERQRRYVRADEGELWLVTLERTPVLLLLREARPNPLGPAFRLASSLLLDGSATSFHGRPAAMLEALPALEAHFSAWPSFGGMALHGL